MWFVYILECKDDSLYTGITTDVERRMKEHAAGNGSKYVRRKGFSRVLHTLAADSRSEASKIEYQVKQLDRNDKITFFMQHPDRIF